MLLAALLLSAVSVVRAADIAGRSELLQEMEVWRGMHLSHSSAKIVELYAPRYTGLKKRVTALQDESRLPRLKSEFENWKTALLQAQFEESKATGMTCGKDFSTFRQEQTLSAAMMGSIQTQIKQASLAGASGSRAFDGTGVYGDGSSALPVSLGGTAGTDAGASRYNKLRAIMVSQGAKPQIVDAAIKESLRQGVDPALTLSVIWQESRFNANATSPVGARGLMQIMSGTGRDMGVHNAGMLYDVQTNLRAGIKYLRYAADYLKLNMNLSDIAEAPAGKVKALLASYNAGIGAVSKWLRHQGSELVRIPYAETRHYVRVIGEKLSTLVSPLGW